MDFTLWPACVKTHDLSSQLQGAAAAGFDSLPIGWLTIKDHFERGLTAADIVAMARNQGVRLGHYDGFSDWAPQRFAADLPEGAKAVFDVSADQCLEVCNDLGLKAICATGAFQPGQYSTEALIDSFASFCDKAAAANIHVDLEFIPMWGIPSLALAWDVVRGAGATNSGILFDSWHFFRGAADLSLLESIPKGVIRTVQLADALLQPQGDSLLDDCLRFRSLPGDGELNIAAVLAILRAKGGVTSIGPEVFSDELDTLSAVQASQNAADACLRALKGSGWPQSEMPRRADALSW